MMLCTHTTQLLFSVFALLFSSSQVSGLSSLLTETLLCIHCILPPPFPFFPFCFASNSLEKRCVPTVFSFHTLSNCPVDLPSLSMHACLAQCSVGMTLLVLRPGLGGLCTVPIPTMTSVPKGLTAAVFLHLKRAEY